MSRVPTMCLLLLAAACSKDRAKDRAGVLDVESDNSVEVIGVAPDQFECSTVAPQEMVSGIVGGRVVSSDSPFDPPAGVARPCQYLTEGDAPVQYSFDIDCRPAALEDGAKLMAHYASGEDAVPINVGESGLDHGSASLLFIDDDAPCYVRILGPEQGKRIALAELVAERLNERTAPSGYRYQRQ